MKTKLMITTLAGASFALLGCTDPDGTYNNIANGVIAGAAAGATTGYLVTDDEDNTTRNVIVGGALGAAGGGLIGQQLEKQEAELRNSLSGSGAKIINTGERLIVSLPEAITFGVDSSAVKESLYGPLNDIATSLNNYPNTIAQVVGHTDSTGAADYNQALSERRASAVAERLIAGGVTTSRVRIVGMGETQPIASNDTDAGRQANRRVEINIIPVQ